MRLSRRNMSRNRIRAIQALQTEQVPAIVNDGNCHGPIIGLGMRFGSRQNQRNVSIGQHRLDFHK